MENENRFIEFGNICILKESIYKVEKFEDGPNYSIRVFYSNNETYVYNFNNNYIRNTYLSNFLNELGCNVIENDINISIRNWIINVYGEIEKLNSKIQEILRENKKLRKKSKEESNE